MRDRRAEAGELESRTNRDAFAMTGWEHMARCVMSTAEPFGRVCVKGLDATAIYSGSRVEMRKMRKQGEKRAKDVHPSTAACDSSFLFLPLCLYPPTASILDPDRVTGDWKGATGGMLR